MNQVVIEIDADPQTSRNSDFCVHPEPRSRGRGASGEGAVFELTPQGHGSWKENVLHSFRKRDGYLPSSGVIFDSSGNLYGTAGAGGDFDDGAVFELTPTGNGGWKEKLLHSFNHLDTYGYYPSAGLIFDSAGNLYSTTSVGGAYGNGTVFELTPRSGGGWRESVLHSFNATDGSYPYTGLIFDSSGNLYGATAYGGAYDAGTAFEITRDKAGRWKENVLHIFNGIPNGPLIFDVAVSLYGTTYAGGGDNDCGTVFRLQPNASSGWEETVLHSFIGHPGCHPFSGLTIARSGNLYGTTFGDGKTTFGSVFEISP